MASEGIIIILTFNFRYPGPLLGIGVNKDSVLTSKRLIIDQVEVKQALAVLAFPFDAMLA